MHNSEHLLRRMKLKGWAPEELDHARLVFSEHQLHHHILHPIWDATFHWVLFAKIILSNIFAFFFILPLILIIQNPLVYIYIFILGLSLGLVFELVLDDLNHLEKHHHFFISLVIPAISVVLFLGSMYIVQQKADVQGMFSSPMTISLIYVFAFMFPYYIKNIYDWFMRR